MTKRRRRVQKLPGTVHLLPALAMCTAQGNPSYRPPTQLRSREDAEIVSRFVPASPRGQSASRHRSGHLWPRSPPTAGRSASRHQYTDARELLHGYHSSNIAGGGGRPARGARAGRRAGRRLSRPIQWKSVPSADDVQYRTFVRRSPTNTSSQTARTRPSTKGSRWPETNH